ncbi:MAG: cytochrome c oxidase subunit 4 [Candidatus Dormibacter sp.]|mgnify:CR=1 FL=1
MAAQEPTHEGPQGHEAIHLPPPSIWPVVLAVGIATLLLGLVLNLVLLVIGAVITVAALALWVRDARREFADLPE